MPKYTVILIPEEGGYSVGVPALPGYVTQGETKEEALAMVKEAIELYMESLQADGESIPIEPTLETAVVEVTDPVG